MNLQDYAERQARYQKIIDMYNEGYVVGVIADKFGITKQMVHYILNQNGVKKRRDR